ncbi:MAG TPA: hypothetical protein VHK28_07545 [Candidatus Limnocylindria bacterium]|nr:hypothetical protein [Candidatus Limnocylindria bacterium]
MNSAVRWATLSFRLQRWEVAASVVGVLLLVSAMAWFTWHLRDAGPAQLACQQSASTSDCMPALMRFDQLTDTATRLLYLSWAAPFGMGLLLGVPLVAREVENRTSAIAWTLSRSRLAWLGSRLAFVGLVLVVLLAAIAVASEALATALLPTLDLDADFTWHGRRGWLVVARGLAALGIGLLVGALIGRVLPALLAAAFASVLIFTAVSIGMDRWNESEAVLSAFAAGPEMGDSLAGGLTIGGRIELASGELVSWEYLNRQGYEQQMIDMDGAIYTRFDEQTGEPDESSFIGWDRMLVVPGPMYPVVVLRESGVATGVALLFGLLAARVVVRRRVG